MANEFKIGNIVKLKSGGPAMTVTSISFDQTTIYTSWFAGKKAESGGFPPDALKAVPDGEEGDDE